eukprot:m.2752 g.2752  ORF g.2752 m.2752 type:complete len:194 (-) comp2019_c0_seq1:15-596(-)
MSSCLSPTRTALMERSLFVRCCMCLTSPRIFLRFYRARKAGTTVPISSRSSCIDFGSWAVPLRLAHNGHLYGEAVADTAAAVDAHELLGHRNDADVEKLLNHIPSTPDATCHACEIRKGTPAGIARQSPPRTAAPCQLLYEDVAGPREVVTFVDATRFAWTYLIKHKSDVSHVLGKLREDRNVIDGLGGEAAD